MFKDDQIILFCLKGGKEVTLRKVGSVASRRNGDKTIGRLNSRNVEAMSRQKKAMTFWRNQEDNWSCGNNMQYQQEDIYKKGPI